MGVGIVPSVLVTQAANISMQALFNLQKAILLVDKALITGGFTVSSDVIQFKLEMYSLARNNFIERIVQLTTIPTQQFSLINPPLLNAPHGLTADVLLERADARAVNARDSIATAISRIEAAIIDFQQQDNFEAAAMAMDAMDTLLMAQGQIDAGIIIEN